MHSKICSSTFFALAALIPYIAAHGVIINAVGDASNVQGAALGMDTSTPRDGTRRRPFQQDTTVFEEDDDELAAATGCGETLKGGTNDIAGGMAQMAAAGAIPQVSAGGELTMTLHQVNADGAGPYTCMIDMTGTGASFQPLQVTTQVPGERGRDRDGETTAFPLTVSMPANMQCTGSAGGAENLCMVRCQNPARNGPFGGCVPVQQMGGNVQQVANPNVGGGNQVNDNQNQNQVNDNQNQNQVNGGQNTNAPAQNQKTGNQNTNTNTGTPATGGNNQAVNRNQKKTKRAALLTDDDFIEEDEEEAEEAALAEAAAKKAAADKAAAAKTPARRFRFHRH